MSIGCAVLLGLAGCAGTPALPAAPAQAAAPQPPLADLIQQARQSAQAGQPETARRQYREAARAYPAAQEPWLRLAEDYFRDGDYGNAILAAQEVLQRDARNQLAHSVLAVSGLRVSAQALGELRERQVFDVGSRDEAVELTRQLRSHLGENVLVPQKTEAVAETPRAAPALAGRHRAAASAPRAPASPAASVAAAPSGTPAAPQAAVAAASAPSVKPVATRAPVVPKAPAAAPPAATGGDPFKVLK